MAIFRHSPYGGYNFLVSVDGREAGFAEVVLPTATIEVIDYRSGNDPTNEPRRLLGTTAYSNAILRRGITGSLDLWQWFDGARNGDQERRTVVVTLLRESREPVLTWKLRNCIPVKYVGPTLNATASDVAIEEVELLVERLDVE